MSIGAGGTRPRMPLEDYQRMFVIEFATTALRSMIWDTHVLTKTLLQWLSNPVRRWPINSEVGDLGGDFIGRDAETEEYLTYARYDIDFSSNWIETELGLKFVDRYLKNLNRIMAPEVMQPTYELAKKAALKQIDVNAFPSAFH